MNINKDGKTLYFSDDEIDSCTNGEKKVYVTKRINGKESHQKVDKDLKSKFDFNNEIVIGVTKKEPQDTSKSKKENNNNKKKRNKNNTIRKSNAKNKKTKRKKSSKKMITFLSCCLLIAIVIIFAFTTPIFNISNIEVTGNSKIPTDTIISISGLKKGQNIFKFNNSTIQNIKENKYIDEVQIKRKLPGTIIISVKEREVKYQIKLLNSYAYIDKNGYILEVSTVKQEVPIIVGFNMNENELINKKRLEIEDLEELNKILKVMDAAKTINIDSIITEINVENKDNYYFFIENQSKKVYIGDTSNLTKKMLYIKKILEEESDKSGMIFTNGDISSGFKPYFRQE